MNSLDMVILQHLQRFYESDHLHPRQISLGNGTM
jgi:hypothetical protein